MAHHIIGLQANQLPIGQVERHFYRGPQPTIYRIKAIDGSVMEGRQSGKKFNVVDVQIISVAIGCHKSDTHISFSRETVEIDVIGSPLTRL